MAALQKGDYRTAHDLFAKEVARAPYNDEFHYWLAVADVGLGETESARWELAQGAGIQLDTAGPRHSTPPSSPGYGKRVRRRPDALTAAAAALAPATRRPSRSASRAARGRRRHPFDDRRARRLREAPASLRRDGIRPRGRAVRTRRRARRSCSRGRAARRRRSRSSSTTSRRSSAGPDCGSRISSSGPEFRRQRLCAGAAARARGNRAGARLRSIRVVGARLECVGDRFLPVARRDDSPRLADRARRRTVAGGARRGRRVRRCAAARRRRLPGIDDPGIRAQPMRRVLPVTGAEQRALLREASGLERRRPPRPKPRAPTSASSRAGPGFPTAGTTSRACSACCGASTPRSRRISRRSTGT